MEYRSMEKLGVKTSLLGFGCMRFPVNAEGKIDRPRAKAMLQEAIAAGVNYIDTAYPYHSGESEPFVGEVLKEYNREDFYLATKLPMWYVKEESDVMRLLNEQLERLQMDYVDFYLVHSLNKEHFETVKRLGVVDILEQARKDGKIRYLGFSFHDDYEVFEEIVNYHNWDFCQIQYNYMDTDVQAGDKGYRLTEEKGIPLVIMEPIKGGALTGFAEDIVSMFKEQDKDASLASWALRWVATHPNVKVVLSGMSTEEHVKDNLHTFTPFQPLSEEEQTLVNDIVKTIKSRVKNGCTGCRYCMPCPFGVDIPANFSIWNNYGMYNNAGGTKWRYNSLEEGKRANQCQGCGACEEVCPQKISIRENLAKLHEEISAL